MVVGVTRFLSLVAVLYHSLVRVKESPIQLSTTKILIDQSAARI